MANRVLFMVLAAEIVELTDSEARSSVWLQIANNTMNEPIGHGGKLPRDVEPITAHRRIPNVIGLHPACNRHPDVARFRYIFMTAVDLPYHLHPLRCHLLPVRGLVSQVIEI